MEKGRFVKMALSVTAVVLALMLNVQNVQAGKLNLVVNGGFENGVVQWSGPGVADSVEFKDGKSSLKLDGAGKPVFLYDQQGIWMDMKPLTEYVLSWDSKRTTAEKGKVMAGVLEKAKKTDGTWTSEHLGKMQVEAGKWEHFELKFTTGTEIADAIVILYNIETEGTVWYDNVSVVEAK